MRGLLACGGDARKNVRLRDLAFDLREMQMLNGRWKQRPAIPVALKMINAERFGINEDDMLQRRQQTVAREFLAAIIGGG